ncbi:MAG TPA: alpha/beta fold hydrolase [Actinomycetota bacterium]
MATFVIVHGGWGGGWEWRHVANELIRLGHAALTPTLTGLGERSHLLAPSITLDTHAADVTGLLEWERLDDAILVGHSYGGMVTTVAATDTPDRIRALIYVDAFIPMDGQREIDLIDGEWVDEHILRPARVSGDGWLVPFPFPDDVGELTPDDAERYRNSIHPLATFTGPARVGDHVAGIPSAFVPCTRKAPGDDAFAESLRIALERDWPIREISSGHDVQLEDPRGAAAILHELSTIL